MEDTMVSTEFKAQFVNSLKVSLLKDRYKQNVAKKIINSNYLLMFLPDTIWWTFAGKKNFIFARNFRIYSCEVGKHKWVAYGKQN